MLARSRGHGSEQCRGSSAAVRTDAQALLALINTLSQREWEQKMHKIFVSDPVQGPLAVAWLLQQVLKANTRQDAPLVQPDRRV